MSAARLLERQPDLEGGAGRVLSVSGRECLVEDGCRRVRATRARSCLLAPRVDDTVLFAGAGEGALYVLAVLERADKTTELEVDGPVRLAATECEIRAPKSVTLRAGEKVALTGSAVEVRANRADAYVERLGLLGRRVVVEVERIRSVASQVDRLVGTLRERLQSSDRTVEEMERVRAGSLDVAAEGLARVHGRHTLVGGEELVKVNGKQVHLG